MSAFTVQPRSPRRGKAVSAQAIPLPTTTLLEDAERIEPASWSGPWTLRPGRGEASPPTLPSRPPTGPTSVGTAPPNLAPSPSCRRALTPKESLRDRPTSRTSKDAGAGDEIARADRASPSSRILGSIPWKFRFGRGAPVPDRRSCSHRPTQAGFMLHDSKLGGAPFWRTPRGSTWQDLVSGSDRFGRALEPEVDVPTSAEPPLAGPAPDLEPDHLGISPAESTSSSGPATREEIVSGRQMGDCRPRLAAFPRMRGHSHSVPQSL